MPITGGYKMWYSGWTTGVTHESIGYATSTDGIFWQRDTLNNPVLEDGAAGSWDDVGVYLPSVLFIDNLYYLWYGGMGSVVQIGLATSQDGINWTKHPENPVLKPSSPGHWDDYYVEEGRVIFMDDTLYMWYGASGGSGSNYVWQIGLATSPFVPVSVDDNSIQPSEFILNQNYPNPFNPYTTIKYSVPQLSNVVIKVFDVLGNEIATLMDEEKSVGTYEVTWYAEDLPSGVYFYQLKAGSFIETKKMVLMK